MTKFKKALLYVGAAMTPALCFAEGESTPFQTALDDVTTGITDIVGDIVPKVALVVVAGIAIWAIPYAWKKLRKGA